MSIAGGGAMGTVYPGLYYALGYSGIFEQLEHVAGASAGSIIAAILAVGMPPLALRNRLMDNGIHTMLGAAVGTWPLPRTGTPISTFVHQNIHAVTKEYLEDNVGILPELESKLQDPNYEITFKDLADLHRAFPRKFKELTVTATRKDTGELKYFDCHTTPNVSVAMACQASCAIPGILHRVEIDGAQYVDGGIRNNSPVDNFDPDTSCMVELGYPVDDKLNPIHQALHASRANEVINEQRFDALLTRIITDIINTSDQTPASLRGSIWSSIHSFFVTLYGRQITPAEEIGLVDFHAMLSATIEKEINCAKLSRFDNMGALIALFKANIHHMFYHSKPAILYKAPPQLFYPNLFDKFFRNWFVPRHVPNHGGTNTEIREETMRKLFRDPLRCMQICVGPMAPFNFAKATKFYRPLNAIGFLDAINYLANYDRYNPAKFNPTYFYANLVHNFEIIYKASLIAKGQNYAHDKLFNTIFTTEGLSIREQYYRIRDSLKMKLGFPWYFFYNAIDYALDSPQAFALTRAVEYTEGIITDEVLFREICVSGAERSWPSCFTFFKLSPIANREGTILALLHTIHDFQYSRPEFGASAVPCQMH